MPLCIAEAFGFRKVLDATFMIGFLVTGHDADGAWVRQSEWVSSNAMAVPGEGGLILVDPGID